MFEIRYVKAGDAIPEQVGDYGDRIVRLIGRKYLLLKCKNPHQEFGIYFTEKHQSTCSWGEVLRSSPDCKGLPPDELSQLQRKNRVFMLMPEWGHGFHCLPDDFRIIDERAMEGKDPLVQPFVIVQPKERE